MKSARRMRLTALMPLVLTLSALWLLIGCLYIPTPQRLHLTGSKKDFRPLVGHAGSQKAIVERRISRAAVEALLGPPPYASANRRRLLYVIHLKKGIWIMPLCFTVASGEDRAVGLLLDFDESGMLNHWKQIEMSSPFYLFNGGAPAEITLVSSANGAWPSNPSTQPASRDWELKSTRTTPPD